MSVLKGLVPLCDWARYLNCGQSRPAADPTAAGCCANPVVISMWTPKRDRTAA